VHPVIFTAAASTEVTEAQDWYEGEVVGLGRRFRKEVDLLVQRIVTAPRQFPVVYKNVRRAVLRRFPYTLMFVLGEDNTLTVIACFHGSRNPARWRERI